MFSAHILCSIFGSSDLWQLQLFGSVGFTEVRDIPVAEQGSALLGSLHGLVLHVC